MRKGGGGFFKGRVPRNRLVKGWGKGAPARETMSSVSSVRYVRVSFTSFSFSSSYLEDQDKFVDQYFTACFKCNSSQYSTLTTLSVIAISSNVMLKHFALSNLPRSSIFSARLIIIFNVLCAEIEINKVCVAQKSSFQEHLIEGMLEEKWQVPPTISQIFCRISNEAHTVGQLPPWV